MTKPSDPETEILVYGGYALFISVMCLWFLGLLTRFAGPKAIDLLFVARWLASMVVAFGVFRSWRWAWAPGVCLFGIYALLGAVTGVWTLRQHLEAIRITGFELFSSLMIVGFPFALAFTFGAAAVKLWRHREYFDVLDRPRRQLVFQGIAPALAFAAIDFFFVTTRLAEMNRD